MVEESNSKKLERLRKLRALREDNKRRELGRAAQDLNRAKEQEARLQGQYNQALNDLSQLANKYVKPLLDQPVSIVKIQDIQTRTTLQRGKIAQAMQSNQAAAQQSAEMQRLADAARQDYLDAHRATERLEILQKEVLKKERRILDIREEEDPY